MFSYDWENIKQYRVKISLKLNESISVTNWEEVCLVVEQKGENDLKRLKYANGVIIRRALKGEKLASKI